MAAGVYITAVFDRGLERVLVRTIHLPSLSLSHFLFLFSLSHSLSLLPFHCLPLILLLPYPCCLVRSNTPVLLRQPPVLGSVCAQRGADNPGQDNRNRPPFVWASMGLMTVTVNSGHRLRPGWVSGTEGPLTRRTKAEKQNKQCLNLPSSTHR